MKPILDCYNDANTAFESWNLADFAERGRVLQQLGTLLPEKLAQVATYQLSHAQRVVSAPQALVSPTGETNELYTQGRGASVLLIDSEIANSDKAVIAMMTALLAAGNSVIICSDNLWVKELLKQAMPAHLLLDGLVQLAPQAHYSQLIQQDIRNFVYIGGVGRTTALSQELAMRSNAITAMVAETDLTNLPCSKDPMLVLRFITEKVRSINITAIGGNAMLLELGSSVH